VIYYINLSKQLNDIHFKKGGAIGFLNRSQEPHLEGSQEPHLEGSQIWMRFLQRGRASIPSDSRSACF